VYKLRAFVHIKKWGSYATDLDVSDAFFTKSQYGEAEETSIHST
jgi:hypothetical protein